MFLLNRLPGRARGKSKRYRPRQSSLNVVTKAWNMHHCILFILKQQAIILHPHSFPDWPGNIKSAIFIPEHDAPSYLGSLIRSTELLRKTAVRVRSLRDRSFRHCCVDKVSETGESAESDDHLFARNMFRHSVFDRRRRANIPA